MKSYSLKELQKHVLQFQTLIGAQLQQIETHPKGLALSLYHKGTVWWILDFTPQSPFSFLFYQSSPWKKKQNPKPVALFLNSHAKNLYLSKVELKAEAGRILEVEWVNTQKICQMEIHLIPRAVNLIVRTEDRSIAWSKPKDIGAPPQIENELDRDLGDIQNEWLEEQAPREIQAQGLKSVDEWEKQKKKNIDKKQKAMEQLKKQLNSGEAEKWHTFGELLKSFELYELGPEWKPYLTKGQSRFEQMEKAFSKAKQLEGKREGTQQRIQILQEEIAQLEQMREPPAAQPKSKSSLMMKAAGAEGRIRKFGNWTASCGKSAADNLALLRRAKAWDLWVHLRDYPSTHAILSIDKNQNVSDEIIREVALWVALESKVMKNLSSGSKLDVVVAECRHVKPIKGDKLGRVHYHNERVLTLVIP